MVPQNTDTIWTTYSAQSNFSSWRGFKIYCGLKTFSQHQQSTKHFIKKTFVAVNSSFRLFHKTATISTSLQDLFAMNTCVLHYFHSTASLRKVYLVSVFLHSHSAGLSEWTQRYTSCFLGAWRTYKPYKYRSAPGLLSPLHVKLKDSFPFAYFPKTWHSDEILKRI